MKYAVGYVMLPFALLIALAACESRKDVFYPLDGGPVVLFSSDAVSYSQSVDVRLRSEEDVLLHYRLKGEYPSAVSTSLVLDEYLWAPGDSTEKDSKTEDIRIIVNEKDSTITIRSLRGKKVWTKEETYKKLSFSLTSEDVYKKQVSAVAHISVSSYRGLKARIDTVTYDEKETRISLSVSAEPNAYNDKATEWEYLFDGEIMFNADGWESQDFRSYNANAGQAARGGYYITSTPLTTVNHVFQSGGAHSVAVRCKSSSGMWGAWSERQIIFTEASSKQ